MWIDELGSVVSTSTLVAPKKYGWFATSNPVGTRKSGSKLRCPVAAEKSKIAFLVMPSKM